MAEFTVTAEMFHVHVTDGRRTAEYDIKASTEREALAMAREMWARREEPETVAEPETKAPTKKAAAKAAS